MHLPLILSLLCCLIPQKDESAKPAQPSPEAVKQVKLILAKAEEAALKIEDKHEQISSLAFLGRIYADAGLRDEAIRVLKRSEELLKTQVVPSHR